MRTRTSFLTALPILAALVLAPACDKKDEAKSDEAKKEDKPSLMLTNDTPACRQALVCCEKMVELDKGSASPEDINLSCSGVGIAADDDMCEDFKKGYAMAIEAKSQELPDACK